MKQKLIIVSLLVLVLLLAAGALYAETTGYNLNWWTVDGGGGHLSGTGYTLDSTIGQPDAGRMSGGNYVLAGGFWGGDRTEATGEYGVYLPTVLRQ
ncbi:MAG: hypothetical protein IPM39_10815 [Chloroflexi bacterium]|nr:hypothetical protein [Chloroflexota bacterium]